MGGSESKYAGTLRGIDKWSKIGEVKDADLVQHKLDNRIGELRLIRIDPHYLPANELSIYNFRTNT